MRACRADASLSGVQVVRSAKVVRIFEMRADCEANESSFTP